MPSPVTHPCTPPDLATWADHDKDWTCPVCKAVWWVSSKDHRHSCMRSDGPVWEKYGFNPDYDGGFPLMQAPRGGITYPRPSPE